MLTNGTFSNDKVHRMSYISILKPTLAYASPMLMASRKTCEEIMKSTKQIFKHANGFPSSMNDNIFHAPFSLGGLNAFNLHIHILSIRIKWLFYALSENQETANMINIAISQHK